MRTLQTATQRLGPFMKTLNHRNCSLRAGGHARLPTTSGQSAVSSNENLAWVGLELAIKAMPDGFTASSPPLRYGSEIELMSTAPLTAVPELSRVEQTDDPYTFRFELHGYLLRTPGGAWSKRAYGENLI